MQSFCTVFVVYLSAMSAVAGQAWNEQLAQQQTAAEAACVPLREKLAGELEPQAAGIWKQLDVLAEPPVALAALAKTVRETATALQQINPDQLTTADDLRQYDQHAQRLAALRRDYELAQAQRRKAVREQAAQSPAGRVLLARLAEVERQIAATQVALASADAQALAAKTRLKNYLAPPPPAGLVAGDGSLLKISPPPAAAERAKRFAARNSPENLAALAREFFAEVDIEAPGLEPARAALRKGEHLAALEAWRDHFFARLANPSQHGLPATWGGDLDTASLLRQPQSEKLAEAMRNVFSTPRAKANVGPPGSIHWADHGPDAAADPLKNPYLDFYTQRGQGGFVDVLGPHLVLLEGYAATGEEIYLERWAAVLDDWAMHAPADMERSPHAVRQYPVLCSFRPVALASTLTDVLGAQPDFARKMPAPTLARIMLAVMEEYPASFVRLARRGIYNWRCIAMTGAVLTSQAFPEFRTAQWQMLEAKRLMELNWTHKILRDGGNLEQGNWGHEPNDQVHLGRAVALLEAHPPAWLDDAWRAEWNDNMALNARYYLHTLKPDGYTYRFSRVPTADKLAARPRPAGAPQPIQVNLLQGEAEAQRRLAWVFGDRASEPPHVTSESLAWYGATMLRGGWQPAASFLYFQCSPNRNTGGREDAGGFSLYDHGHALLLAPPLTVDDRTQNIHHGLVLHPGGKTIYLTCDDRAQPVDARFHASPQFDFTEGAYRGVYQFHRGANAEIFGEYGCEKIAQARLKQGEADTPIEDVEHARQVLHVRGEGLQIVTDRWTSDRQRKFSQHYTLFTPIERGGWKRRIELAKETNRPPLVVDETARLWRTDNGPLPGVSLRQFGSKPAKATITDNALERIGTAKTSDEALATLGSNKLKKWTMGLPLPFYYKLRVDWQTSGPQVLVTAIATRPGDFGDEPFARDLRDVQPIADDGVSGFQATTASGARVSYLTSATSHALAAGRVRIVGEALLVVERQGQLRGVVLGGEKCWLDDKPQRATSDFEFVVAGDQFSTTPIFRPLQPVVLQPEATVFTDTLSVTLACATPGVELRYTLDGSEPTIGSPLYREPIVLTQTTRIKARAFRPGLKETPWTADGTHATTTSWTTYERQPLVAAADARDPQPGLKWEYVAGRWAELFSQCERLPAQKTGVSPELIDVSMRATDGAFAVRCSGYLQVPADGVYTFYAPREWIFPDSECGYDLRLEIAGRSWQPATRRHAHGSWSIALARGAHPLRVTFIDFRPRTPKRELWDGFPHPDIVWRGAVPNLEVSGPGLARKPIPKDWLAH